MNTHDQARKKLEKLGWTDYLNEFVELLTTKRISSRSFDNDQAIFDYISFNLPLCLGETTKLCDVLSHSQSPINGDRKVFSDILSGLENLDANNLPME